MKKNAWLRVVLAAMFALAIGLMPVWTSTSVRAEEQEQQKIIDMYLIGGQSNAGGYSKLSGFDISGTFDNVLYAGEVNRSRANGTSPNVRRIDSFDDYIAVTTGLGFSTSYIGPEFGMAEVLDNLYGSDKKAIIFKSAAGGTALRDVQGGNSALYGNWYPRSHWGQGFTPNSGSPTGVQYYNFIENFKIVYANLVKEGYTPKVKAMVWSQGCDDLGNEVVYESLIKDFMRDIRTDLKTITGDATLDAMPFIWPEINIHFSVHNNTLIPPFVEMQHRVAQDVGGVYIVATNDFTIVGPNGETGGTQYGSDKYHYNAADMREIGNRCGRSILNALGEQVIVINGTGSNGRVTYAVSDDKLTFTVTPARNYKLTRFVVDGKDVFSDMVQYTYTMDNTSENLVVDCIFDRAERLNVVYAYDRSLASIDRPMRLLEGEILSIKISPVKDATIVSVKYGDEDMTYNAQTDRYEYGPVLTADTVKIELKSESGTSGSGDGNNNQGGGEQTEPVDAGGGNGGCSCGGNAAALLSALGAVAAAMFLYKK